MATHIYRLPCGAMILEPVKVLEKQKNETKVGLSLRTPNNQKMTCPPSPSYDEYFHSLLDYRTLAGQILQSGIGTIKKKQWVGRNNQRALRRMLVVMAKPE